jgi:hypothetical protein
MAIASGRMVAGDPARGGSGWHDCFVTERDVAAPPDDLDDLRPPPAVRSHRPRASAALFAAAAVIAGGMALVVATMYDGGTDNSGDEVEGGATETGLPADVTAGPGTPLAGGFSVPEGAELVGPVVVTAVDADGEPAAWSAVLAVVGDDPIAVWSAHLGQVAAADPGLGLDSAAAPGCRPYDDPAQRDGGSSIPRVDPLCELYAGWAYATLTSIDGDVTGRWLLTVSVDGSRGGDPEGALAYPWPGGAAPPPSPARTPPRVGEPLAPETTAYDGDNDRYVLLEGSELVAQNSAGWVTGGFSVLLRVTAGADIDAVAAAYADQATQFEGEPVPPPRVIEHDGTTVSVYSPPGGAGGYSGTVTAVDGPGADDYIAYELFND